MAVNSLQKQPARGPGRPFEKGRSGNPAGRPAGARNQATLAAEALFDSEAEALSRKAVELALGGSEGALRICLDRIIAPRRERPIQLAVPTIRSANDPLGGRNNLRPESFYGPNAGLTEVLIPAGYVATVYDPVFALSPDGKRYVSVPSDTPTTLPPPGLPFSLVFRAEPGKEDVVLRIAATYEAASKRRIVPPAFGALSDCR